MRILYDTNVLVAMLVRRESIIAFKRLLEQGNVVHVSSTHILSEVEEVLAEKLKLTRQKAKAATKLLERQSVIVYPKKVEKVCRDPFDDYVLAAAVEGKVDYLVTADKDLLVLKVYRNVAIITPKDFEAVLRSY